MGNSLPAPTSKNKLDHHIFIEPYGEGRSIMRNKMSGKYIVAVEHTFPCE